MGVKKKYGNGCENRYGNGSKKMRMVVGKDKIGYW